MLRFIVGKSAPSAMNHFAFGSTPTSSSSVVSITPVHSAQEQSPCSACTLAWMGSLEKSGALLPPHSRKEMRDTIGYRCSASSVYTIGCFTSPWITRRCLSGSTSVSPPRAITKCRPFGVIVPLRRWWGVRAALPRGSSLGLLSVRTTFCSYLDGWPYDGTGTPGARLHGPLVNGSAAAVLREPLMPVDIALANTIPCPSSARRSSRPLP